MSLLPSHSEVLVSALSKKKVLKNLAKETRDVNFLDYDARDKKGFKFNGVIRKDSFRISQAIDKADSFIPLIRGKIEKTPMGCILFLNYSLFPSSSFFLGFWSVISIALALFFAMATGNAIYALCSLGLGLGNYLFVRNHFKRKVKISQAFFHHLLASKIGD